MADEESTSAASRLPGAAELRAALLAEHAAIYGYGVVGARTTGEDRTAATEADQEHRDRRDALSARLTAAGITPPPAAPTYTLPFAVTDPVGARKLAVQLEERTAAAWRAATGTTTGADRRTALKALTETSIRALRWRQRANPDQPATVPFPGS